MLVNRLLNDNPFFSICIPQYNRTEFLIEACRSLEAQTFRDFEVCISDDCSTDGGESQLLDFLQRSGLSFRYRRQSENRRYDANLRESITLARGRYCFLLGNDDCLVSDTILEELHAELCRWGAVGVAITNYEDYASAKPFRRVAKTALASGNPSVAGSSYRNMSFVSGILLDRSLAQGFATATWDGTEMYQMFVACRIIASGSNLLSLDKVTVRKDIQIPGRSVDSYASRPREVGCRVTERKLPLNSVALLIASAIGPYIKREDRDSLFTRIVLKLILFTYPFWIFEYRKVQSWKYAAGVCIGMRPGNVTRGMGLGVRARVMVVTAYAIVTAAGLLLPRRLFELLYPTLFRFAKWRTAG